MATRVDGRLFEGLTARQREVLALVADGATNAQVAERLGVSLDGAKWHLREIFARLGVDSREEAAEAWREYTSARSRLGRVAHGLLAFTGWKTAAAGTAVAAAAAGGTVALVAVAMAQGGDTGVPPSTPQATVQSVVLTPTASSGQMRLDPTPNMTPAGASTPGGTPYPVGGTPYPIATPPGAVAPATPAGQHVDASGVSVDPPVAPDTEVLIRFGPVPAGSPLEDRRVRRALLASAPGLGVEVGNHDFPDPVPFDAEDAKRNLMAAGDDYSDFHPNLLVMDRPDQVHLAHAVVGSWQAILGVVVPIEAVDATAWAARVAAGAYELALLPVAGPGPAGRSALSGCPEAVDEGTCALVGTLFALLPTDQPLRPLAATCARGEDGPLPVMAPLCGRDDAGQVREGFSLGDTSHLWFVDEALFRGVLAEAVSGSAAVAGIGCPRAYESAPLDCTEAFAVLVMSPATGPSLLLFDREGDDAYLVGARTGKFVGDEQEGWRSTAHRGIEGLPEQMWVASLP